MFPVVRVFERKNKDGKGKHRRDKRMEEGGDGHLADRLRSLGRDVKRHTWRCGSYHWAGFATRGGHSVDVASKVCLVSSGFGNWTTLFLAYPVWMSFPGDSQVLVVWGSPARTPIAQSWSICFMSHKTVTEPLS